MYDLVGGGFHRYSVDERWLVPHFEKMLYDNALLVPAYLHGWLVTGTSATARWPSRRSTTCCATCAPGGGFASSQDADTDGVEGLTYTWAPGEGAPEELFEPFEDGRFVLRGELDERARARLLEIGRERPQPRRDDKAIASWNGLALAALAEAGRRLGAGRPRRRGPGARASSCSGRSRRPRAGSTAPAATGSAKRDRLPRRLRERRARALELHVASGELRWLEEARRLALLAVELFADDAHGGFFLAPADGEQLVAPQEGARRPPDAVRQLDARLRAPAACAHLRGRRARAAARSACCDSSRDELGRGPIGVRLGARRARPATSRRRGSSRSSARATARSRAPRSSRSTRTPWSPSARPKTSRSSRARASSTAGPPSTRASASSAGAGDRPGRASRLDAGRERP